MKKIVFILFSVIVVIGAWLYSDLWIAFQDEQEQIGLLQQDILALETDHEEILAKLVTEEKNVAELKQEKSALEDELTEALKPEMMTLTHMDPDAGRRFVVRDTTFWFLPGADQASMGTIKAGTLVRVIEQTRNKVDNLDYLYVEIVNYAEPENTRGYINKEDTTYFTPDLEIQVINPLTIPAGSVVFESSAEGEKETVLTEDMKVFKIGEEEEMMLVGSFGGQTFRTDMKNIVYPKSDITYQAEQ